jgi:hypothetical protein
MKRTEIRPGMEVYRVKRTYTWDNLGENPDECRALVVDTDRWMLAPTRPVTYVRNPRGKLVHIRVERDETQHDMYVPIVELRGSWNETRQRREREIAAHRAARGTERNVLTALHNDRNEAIRLAGRLGYKGVEWGRSYTFLAGKSSVFVEVDVVDFKRMLDEIVAARACP